MFILILVGRVGTRSRIQLDLAIIPTPLSNEDFTMARAVKSAKRSTKKAAASSKKAAAKKVSAKKASAKNVSMQDVRGKANEAAEKASELAKSIWLAGLGAYGKAYDEAKTQADQLEGRTTKFFDELVAKGRKLEGETQKTVKQVKTKATKATSSLEDRIAKVRDSLSVDLSGMNPYAKLDEIAHKVDALSRKVDAMSKPAKAAKPKTSKAASAKAETPAA